MTATVAMIAVVVWLLIAEPLLGRRAFQKLLAALDSGDTGARLRFYRNWVWQGWLLVAITLWVSWICGWTPAQLGLVWPHSTDLASMDTVYGIAGGVAIGLVLGTVASALIMRIKGGKSSAKPAAQNANKSQPKILRMLPQNAPERVWFAALSVTAGIGEEVVWRGFGLCVLNACHIHGPAALLVAMLAIPFGWAHFYQGFSGVVATAMVGAALATLYLATGSLLLPIMMHTLFDLRLLLMRGHSNQEAKLRLKDERS